MKRLIPMLVRVVDLQVVVDLQADVAVVVLAADPEVDLAQAGLAGVVAAAADRVVCSRPRLLHASST